MEPKHKNSYLVPALTKAFDIMELIERAHHPLSLETIYRQVKAPKSTVYRLLKTCVHRGYVAQGQDGLYRLANQPRKMRFGFAGQSSEMPFSEVVTNSLKAAATQYGIDLIVLDNHYDSETAVHNAERLVEEAVDLIIEFQIDQSVAALIADKISSAKIPMIAVDMPHPHATYFGADNYRMGFSAGETLARYAAQRWKSKVNWVLGLDLAQAGDFVQNRTSGAFDAIRSHVPGVLPPAFVRIDSRGLRERAHKLVHDFLTGHPRDRRILISAHNDTVALGALDAVREAGREKEVAIAGQDCIAEAIRAMASPGSPFIASVSHAAETYGERLIPLGLAILRGEAVPPYNFTQHHVITQEELLDGQSAPLAAISDQLIHALKVKDELQVRDVRFSEATTSTH